MTKYIFDIEANGFLYDVNKVWCLVFKDVDTEEVYSYYLDNIESGLKKLAKADVLIGHNIVGYDLPVLKKLYDFEFKGQAWDTLVGSRLAYSRLNKHSLDSWGQRFVQRRWVSSGKLNYEGGFDNFSDEMLEYCQQDVEVNYVLYKKVLKKAIDFTADYVRLEHDILEIQTRSEQYGVSFDYESAMKYASDIDAEMDSIKEQVEETLGYHTFEKEHILKKDGKPNHHAVNLLESMKRQFPKFKHKISIDKPNNRSLIKVYEKITLDTKKLLLAKLDELGWQCSWFTDKGSPQMTRQGNVEPNLSSIPGMEGADLGKYYVLKHRKSIIDGFFKNIRSDNKIPSEANTLGAITGRYTHRKIANLPAVRSLYGNEIRGLFGAERVQVGSDLAGIEARILAHYMDDEEFTTLVSGEDADIHTFNQMKAGLPTRDAAKTFYYAFLYGGGDTKIGSLVGGGSKEGADIKDAFFKELPGLKLAIDKAQREAQQGYVLSLDERPVLVTESVGFNGKKGFDVRKALNTLLQSSAAIYFKRWLWFIEKLIKEQKLDAKLMISYHDEVQYDVHPDDVEKFKQVLQQAVLETDKYYKVKCPNAIDIKTGKNWRDCH